MNNDRNKWFVIAPLFWEEHSVFQPIAGSSRQLESSLSLIIFWKQTFGVSAKITGNQRFTYAFNLKTFTIPCYHSVSPLK